MTSSSSIRRPRAVRRAVERTRSGANAIATLMLGAVVATSTTPATAHPHAFVDGGVDFVFESESVLEALEVTWLFDEFETLYTLSASEMELDETGGLAEADRLTLVGQMGDWSDDFDGSAHLSVGGEAIALAPPVGLDVRLVDGRLRTTFTRRLDTPLALDGRRAEIAFYESTYFYAFAVTNPPRLLGHDGSCSADVVPFEPDDELATFRTTLLALEREETPEAVNVGALFADRIVLSCE